MLLYVLAIFKVESLLNESIMIISLAQEMESKVFYLQGDIALLKSQMLKCNQLIVTYKHHISILLTEIAQLQKEIDRLETEDFLNRLLHNGSEYLKNDNIINMNKDGEILDNGEHD